MYYKKKNIKTIWCKKSNRFYNSALKMKKIHLPEFFRSSKWISIFSSRSEFRYQLTLMIKEFCKKPQNHFSNLKQSPLFS